MPYDLELAARIRTIVADEPGLTEKRMFGGVAFLINGNMAVSASGQGGLLLRVEPERTDALIREAGASRAVMRGRDGRLAADQHAGHHRGRDTTLDRRGPQLRTIAPAEVMASRLRHSLGRPSTCSPRTHRTCSRHPHGSPPATSQSAIHLATARDPHDENPDLLIVDDIHHAEVTDPQPHRAGGLPGQGTYPGRTWISRQAGDRPQDPAGSLLVQFAQLP
jgi:hypothetical protein